MSSRIFEIDGLRAIAMTMVIAQHCGLLPFGWIGVWLFYGISGFVITRGFVQEESSRLTTGRRFGNFMLRRFFRIVPVYVLYLTINVGVFVFLSEHRYYQNLPFLSTFTFNWFMIFAGGQEHPIWSTFGHLWTLSVEEQFYIFYPLIALLAPKQIRIKITLVFIVLGLLIRFGYSEIIAQSRIDREWSAFSVYASSVCHFDAFLMGSLIARLEPKLYENPKISNWCWIIAVSSLMVYIIAYLNINHQAGDQGIDQFRNIISGILFGQYREVFLYSVVNLMVSASLVHVILQRSFSKILSSKFVVLVGSISYGGYLFHMLVLWVFKYFVFTSPIKEHDITTRLGIFLLVWTSTVLIAYVSYKLFEMPTSKWGRSYIKK